LCSLPQTCYNRSRFSLSIPHTGLEGWSPLADPCYRTTIQVDNTPRIVHLGRWCQIRRAIARRYFL
jgi:hypothetical protein